MRKFELTSDVCNGAFRGALRAIIGISIRGRNCARRAPVKTTEGTSGTFRKVKPYLSLFFAVLHLLLALICVSLKIDHLKPAYRNEE